MRFRGQAHPESRSDVPKSQKDFDLLGQQGFTDEQISIAVQVIGYFNYINRVAEGLGVDPEDWMKPARTEWYQRKAKEYF